MAANPLTTGTADTISSQFSFDVKDFSEKAIKNILPEAKIVEVRHLSYAFTNKTLLVRLKGARVGKVIIKICLKEDRHPKLHLEASLIARIADETDLPVPKILYQSFNTDELPFPYIIYGFLPGENLADAILHLKNKAELGRELAKVSAQLHKISFPTAELSLASANKGSRWKSILLAIIETGVRKMRQNNYPHADAVHNYALEHLAKVKEPSRYSLIHRDLQPQNLHWDNKSKKIVGVFDFESAMSGDFHFEFNFMERKLFKEHPVIRDAFYEEYRKYHKLAHNHLELVKFYEVIRDLYFYERDIKYGELERADGDLESIERLVFDNWKVG